MYFTSFNGNGLSPVRFAKAPIDPAVEDSTFTQIKYKMRMRNEINGSEMHDIFSAMLCIKFETTILKFVDHLLRP